MDVLQLNRILILDRLSKVYSLLSHLKAKSKRKSTQGSIINITGKVFRANLSITIDTICFNNCVRNVILSYMLDGRLITLCVTAICCQIKISGNIF